MSQLKSTVFAHTPPWLCWIATIAAVALYQSLLLGHGHLALFAPEFLDQTFNSMLTHMLHGDFFVDPDAISLERFVRDGHTIAYFEIFPALLRLPVLAVVPDLHGLHLARISCVTAGTAFIGICLRSVQVAHRSVPESTRNPILYGIILLSVPLCGPTVFLGESAYVYKEPVLWAAVLAAWFNLTVIRTALNRTPLSNSALSLMAVLAGLALNTRATVGVDLCVGFGLIWLLSLWGRLRKTPDAPGWQGLVQSALLMLAGVIVVGVVHQARWGSPFTFIDYHDYYLFALEPTRMTKFLQIGTFNLTRIPLSTALYSFGLYYTESAIGSHVHLLIDLYDGIDGPLVPPILAAPLLVILAALGLRSMLGNAMSAAAYAGHVMAGLLLLAAMYVATRYGMDFIGLFLLPAAFGYREASLILAKSSITARRTRLTCLIAFLVFGIGVSQYEYVITSITNATVPTELRCAWHPLAPFLRLGMWTAVPAEVIGATPPGCVVITTPPV